MLKNRSILLVALVLLVGIAVGWLARTVWDKGFIIIGHPKIDPVKFESVYRAAKAIQGSTEVGVPYQKFGELLQNFSTELSIANDKATSEEEKKLLEIYYDGLAMYKDSHSLWKVKIRASSNRVDGKIEVPSYLKPVTEKYNIPIEHKEIKLSFLNKTLSVDLLPADSIQRVWLKAGEQLEKANSLFLENSGYGSAARHTAAQEKAEKQGTEKLPQKTLGQKKEAEVGRE